MSAPTDVRSRPGSGIAAAFGFLTRLPVARSSRLEASSLAVAAVWFPLVGAAVGALAGGARLLAELALPPDAATAIALAVAALVTGGLHEDGLADTADGFGAHVSRARRLEIMRDPRVGTYGSLALILVTLLAWTLLAGMSGADCLRAAVLGHVLSRWAMLVHAATTPPAREDGAGVLLHVTPSTITAATILAVAISVVATSAIAAAASALAALLIAAAFAILSRRVIGGATGDTHGAVGKLSEVACYAVAAAFTSG